MEIKSLVEIFNSVFDSVTGKLKTENVPVNSSGTELFTPSNPGNLQLSGSLLQDSDSLPTHQTTLMSGEDQENNLIVVENRYNHKNLNALATTTVKSIPGFLHSVVINTAGGAGNTITLYDGTDTNGEKIATIDSTSMATRTYNVQFAVGLTVVVAGGTAGDITVAYR